MGLQLPADGLQIMRPSTRLCKAVRSHTSHTDNPTCAICTQRHAALLSSITLTANNVLSFRQHIYSCTQDNGSAPVQSNSMLFRSARRLLLSTLHLYATRCTEHQLHKYKSAPTYPADEQQGQQQAITSVAMCNGPAGVCLGRCWPSALAGCVVLWGGHGLSGWVCKLVGG
jgi:hypothetical protein